MLMIQTINGNYFCNDLIHNVLFFIIDEKCSYLPKELKNRRNISTFAKLIGIHNRNFES
jgi:hypothetical protein